MEIVKLTRQLRNIKNDSLYTCMIFILTHICYSEDIEIYNSTLFIIY